MARDIEGLKIRKWADNLTLGGSGRIEPQNATDVVSREAGWPASYEVDQYPPRGAFNQVWREFSGELVDIAEHGVLEWSMSQNGYIHPAVVLGSDYRLYLSVQSSGGALTAIDPVSNTSRSHWVPLINTATGSLAFASNATIETGTESGQAISPAGLLSLIGGVLHARWQATTSQYGFARQATATQLAGRSGTGYVSAADLPPFASNSQVEAGTTVARAISPAGLLSLIGGVLHARWQATTSQYGFARQATASQIASRTGTAYVSAADLPSSLTQVELYYNESGLALTSSGTGTTVTLSEGLSGFRYVEFLFEQTQAVGGTGIQTNNIAGLLGTRSSARVIVADIPASNAAGYQVDSSAVTSVSISSPSDTTLRFQRGQLAVSLHAVIGSRT